jgi:hypothetical protein
LLPAIVAFTFISFLLDGLILLFQLIAYIHVGNEALEQANIFTLDATYILAQIPTDYAPAILIFLLGIMVWFLRFMWLSIIVTLKKPIKRTYKLMGGIDTSLAISFLLFLTYTSVLILFSLFAAIVSPIFATISAGNEDINIFIGQIILNLAFIIALFIFMAGSTHALFEVEKRRLGL